MCEEERTKGLHIVHRDTLYFCSFTTDVCIDGDIRVIGGDTIYSGRAEICIDGQFGTICDENWDNTDAVVFCSQLTGVTAAGE